MISSKLLNVLCFINKDNSSLPLINTKRLQGKILSVLWQEKLKRITILCRCKLDSWNEEEKHHFLKDCGNCYLDFPSS